MKGYNREMYLKGRQLYKYVEGIVLEGKDENELIEPSTYEYTNKMMSLLPVKDRTLLK